MMITVLHLATVVQEDPRVPLRGSHAFGVRELLEQAAELWMMGCLLVGFQEWALSDKISCAC